MEDDILNAGEGEGDEVEIGDSLLPPDAAPITFNNFVIKYNQMFVFFLIKITFLRRLGLSSLALVAPLSRPSRDEARDTDLEPGFCLKHDKH